MYYQLPKQLLTDDRFSILSLYAIVLYCILKDRNGLSEMTERLDDNGRPYIFFSRREMAKLLRVSERSAIRYMKELSNAGLISFGNKDGCTSPPIYVNDLSEKKKPAADMRQEKSYDSNEVRDALLRQFMEGW